MSFVPNKLMFTHSALGDIACIFRLAAARGDLVQAIRIRRLLHQYLGAIAFTEYCHAEDFPPFDRLLWRCRFLNQVEGGRVQQGYEIEGVRELRALDDRADVRLRIYVRERTQEQESATSRGQPPVFEVLRILHDGWP